jgi:mRNA interferase MazF
MTTYKPGEVVLVKFPFTSGAGSKPRPAIVVLDSGDNDLVVARITTQSSQTLYDISVTEWRGAGLLAPSNVRLHKMATLEKSDIHRTLGRL